MREVTSPTLPGKEWGEGCQAAEPQGPDGKRPLVSWALSPPHLELVPFSLGKQGPPAVLQRQPPGRTQTEQQRPSALGGSPPPARPLWSCVPSASPVSQLCEASSPAASSTAARSQGLMGSHPVAAGETRQAGPCSQPPEPVGQPCPSGTWTPPAGHVRQVGTAGRGVGRDLGVRVEDAERREGTSGVPGPPLEKQSLQPPSLRFCWKGIPSKHFSLLAQLLPHSLF